MINYVVRRLLWTVITLFGVSVLTFVLIFAGPVDPARALSGEKSQSATIEAVRERFGLDQPVHIQYIRYISSLARGDLGTSFYFNQPVSEALRQRVAATAKLAFFTVLLIVVIGIPAGSIAALRANTPIDRVITIFGMTTISLPTFFVGLLLMYFFCFRLRCFPCGGYGRLSHFVLPAISVAVPWSAWYAMILRTSMLDVMSANYVQTAYAKGLTERAVVVGHMLRNAILPVVTMLGMDMVALLTGLALVEYIFGWPGIGWLTVQAAEHYDVPLIMGSILFSTLLMQGSNLLVDVAYTWLDPRIRLE